MTKAKSKSAPKAITIERGANGRFAVASPKPGDSSALDLALAHVKDAGGQVAAARDAVSQAAMHVGTASDNVRAAASRLAAEKTAWRTRFLVGAYIAAGVLAFELVAFGFEIWQVHRLIH
jgi:hypothetical protein